MLRGTAEYRRDADLSLGLLEHVVELLGVELEALEQAGGARDDEQQLADEPGQVGHRLDGLVLGLGEQALEVLRHLVEVAARDELLLRLEEAVAPELDHLVLHEAHDGYRRGGDGRGERRARRVKLRGALRHVRQRVLRDERAQPLLHLLRGLSHHPEHAHYLHVKCISNVLINSLTIHHTAQTIFIHDY